jgi:hypothetical protein
VAGVGGVGAEGGGAVVEGHHAALLAHAVGVGDEVRVLLEGAWGGVDATVLEEDGLGAERVETARRPSLGSRIISGV